MHMGINKQEKKENFDYQFQNNDTLTCMYMYKGYSQIITILGIHNPSTNLFYITSNSRGGVYYFVH